jgi:hypothetical protein
VCQMLQELDTAPFKACTPLCKHCWQHLLIGLSSVVGGWGGRGSTAGVEGSVGGHMCDFRRAVLASCGTHHVPVGPRLAIVCVCVQLACYGMPNCQLVLWREGH